MSWRTCSGVVFLFLFFLAPAQFTTFADGPEIIANPSFETAGADEKTAADWNYGSEGDFGGVPLSSVIYRTDARAHTGSWSTRVDTSPLVTKVDEGQISPVVHIWLTSWWGGTDPSLLVGKPIRLSFWTFYEGSSGRERRPFNVRVRIFLRSKSTGEFSFAGDALLALTTGAADQWVQNTYYGRIDFDRTLYPPENYDVYVDVHSLHYLDQAPLKAWFDDFSLKVIDQPGIDLTVLRRGLWTDERVIPVEISGQPAGAQTLRVEVLDGATVVQTTERPFTTGILALRLNGAPVDGKRYVVRASALDSGGGTLASDDDWFAATATAWSGGPPASQSPSARPIESNGPAAAGSEIPPPFASLADTAPDPAWVTETIPAAAEPISPDVDLTPWDHLGYVVFQRHWQDLPTLKGRPRPGETTGAIRLFGAPGEVVRGGLSVWNRTVGATLGVAPAISDLTGPGGATIPAASADLRVARIVNDIVFYEKWPSFGIPEDQARSWLIQVYIPPGAGPGEYTGTVSVAPAGKPAVSVPIRIRVLDLAGGLPESDRAYGFWGRFEKRWDPVYGFATEADQRSTIPRIYSLFRNDGFNQYTLWGHTSGITAVGSEWVKDCDANKDDYYDPGECFNDLDGDGVYDYGKPLVNMNEVYWSEKGVSTDVSVADVLQMARDVGFYEAAGKPIPVVWRNALEIEWVYRYLFHVHYDTPEYRAIMSSTSADAPGVITQWEQWARQNGWRFGYYAFDEFGDSTFPDAYIFFRNVSEVTIDGTCANGLATLNDYWAGRSAADWHTPWLDFAAPGVIETRLLNAWTPDLSDLTRASGDEYWFYNMVSDYAAPRQPITNRMVWGLFQERHASAGYGQWVAEGQWGDTPPVTPPCEDVPSPWKLICDGRPLSGPPPEDYCFYILPAPMPASVGGYGRLPTLHYYSAAAGVTDARYLQRVRGATWPACIQPFMDEVPSSSLLATQELDDEGSWPSHYDGSVLDGLRLRAAASYFYYHDGDSDGFGDPAARLVLCDPAPPAGYVANGTDCDDSNPDVWATPGEARNLRFPADKVTLEWTPPVEPGSVVSALVYDLLRSGNPADFDPGAVCIASDRPEAFASDPIEPDSGTAFCYLARAQNACPLGVGPLGSDSLGRPRTGRACP